MPHRYFTPPAPEPQADGDGTYERSGAPHWPGLLSPAELIYDLERRAFDEPWPFSIESPPCVHFAPRTLRPQPFDPRD